MPADLEDLINAEILCCIILTIFLTASLAVYFFFFFFLVTYRDQIHGDQFTRILY